MEKETKRALQNILQILTEQQRAIAALREKLPSTHARSDDGIADRVERVAEEVSKRQSFEIDWGRLCDRHYAKRI